MSDKYINMSDNATTLMDTVDHDYIYNDDHIAATIDDLTTITLDFPKDPIYTFNEGKYIQEFKSYVDSTYNQHYAKDKFQATEFIIDGGHGTGFCIGNVLKYAQRYGKKGSKGDARKDLMKVLHYALLQLYVHDQEMEK